MERHLAALGSPGRGIPLPGPSLAGLSASLNFPRDVRRSRGSRGTGVCQVIKNLARRSLILSQASRARLARSASRRPQCRGANELRGVWETQAEDPPTRPPTLRLSTVH